MSPKDERNYRSKTFHVFNLDIYHVVLPKLRWNFYDNYF